MHKETPETLYHNIPGLQVAHTAGLPTEREGFLEAQLSSSLLAGVWTELRKLSREEQCLL